MSQDLKIYKNISEENSSIPFDIFCELNDVDGIIRIPEVYFPSLANGQSIMHVHPNNDDHAE